jgi:hypothetical protein
MFLPVVGRAPIFRRKAPKLCGKKENNFISLKNPSSVIENYGQRCRKNPSFADTRVLEQMRERSFAF